MVRKDKKNRICECCGKTLATPQKLRQHYSSTKNQCSLPSENNNQRRVRTPKVTRPVRPKSPELQPPPRPRSPSPAPVVHTRGRDRRMEKPKVVIPTSEPQIAPTKDQAEEYIDIHTRKSGEHLRTWGARLRRRWIELTGEECDLPKTLKECQRLHHDLLQADDDEACENILKPELHPTQQNEDQRIEDPEAGPGPATQANRKKSAKPKERKIVIPITAVDIHFEERSVGIDLERPHQNRSIMTIWTGEVPHPEENPASISNKNKGSLSNRA
ncbi:unnamed protein product [Rhizophagus irregularis]|nr:unnamed protein product [Rhizophagus irregularis]CAB5392707.1 unnamed protein product [Rhizophagus irregularis]